MADTFDKISNDIKKISKDHKNPDLSFNKNKLYESFTTGSFIVDRVTGVGGFAVRRRLTEVFGYESGGKTTLSIQTCANAQKNGFISALIDYEKAYDYEYAKSLGIDHDGKTFEVFQPNSAEEGEKVIDKIITKMGGVDLLIIDSVAACKPSEMMNIRAGVSSQKGIHAQYWSEFSYRLVNYAQKCNMAVLLTNQMRMKPIMGQNAKYSVSNTGLGAGFSNTDTQVTTTGGTALRFYLSARYLLYPIGQIKEPVEDDTTGEIKEIRVANKIYVKNIKNKMATPFCSDKFVIHFGTGTDDSIPIFDIMKGINRIVVSGSHLSYKSSNGDLDFKENGKYRFMKRFSDEEIQKDAIKILTNENAFGDTSDIEKNGTNQLSITIKDEKNNKDGVVQTIEID